MSFTIEQFRARFPQFVSDTAFPDALIDAVIQEAYRRISPTFFGSRTDDAWRYLTAHILATTASAAAAASSVSSAGVRSVTAGSVSITYGESSDSGTGAADFSTTNYGQQYEALIKLIGGARLSS